MGSSLLPCSCMDKDMEFFEIAKNGELVSVMEKDITDCSEVFTERTAAGLRSLNSAVNGSLLLYWTSPKLCMVSLSVVPIVGVGAMSLAKYSRRMTEQQRNLQSEILSYSLERFSNFSTVKLNGRQEYEKRVFSALAEKSQHLADNKHYAQGSFMGYLNMATNCALLAVLKVGGDMIRQGDLTAGALTRFALQSAFVGLGFSGLSSFYSDMLKSLDSASRVFDMIDKNDQCKDSRGKSFPAKRQEADPAPPADFFIELQDVSFSYRSRPTVLVLNGLTVTVSPRQITCFVGESGSGKSSLAALMCGLYRPLTGIVRVGGRTLKSISGDGKRPQQIQTDLETAAQSNAKEEAAAEEEDDVLQFIQRHVGVVEQSGVALLSGTIAFNIGYGKIDATREEIERAAKAAFAYDFIMSLPQGFDTEIGVSGGYLSGGQRARVAIARALVKDPPCLLLDEVTAALDANSEREVLKVLDSLRGQKTMVILTHSPAMMQIADIVYAMEGGSCRPISK